MSLTAVVLASFAVMTVSLSGKLVIWRGLGPTIERNLHFLVSFAAGVLLVIAFNLSGEIVEHAGSFAAGVPWIVAGSIAILVLFRFIPHFHHHHDKGARTHSKIDANRILMSDAIHNIGDGAVIALSFAASGAIGVATVMSIMIHEMLQEISEFFVLREAGLSVRMALALNFLASSTILIGALAAYYLVEQFEALEMPLLGLAVGSYLVVVFHDLIPHSIESSQKQAHAIRHIIYFLAGLASMALIVYALPHEPSAEYGQTAYSQPQAGICYHAANAAQIRFQDGGPGSILG